LREFMNLRVVVSIDNIVVFSKSEMKHHVLVVNILQQLCSWLKTEYLQLERRPPGFWIDKDMSGSFWVPWGTVY
jgi:hypothetical protein